MLIRKADAPIAIPAIGLDVFVRILGGRYLYEMDGRQFYAEPGDMGGAEHGFANVTDEPARRIRRVEFLRPSVSLADQRKA